MENCPVCGRSGLLPSLHECPQCHADLACFQWLDTLHDGETCQKNRPTPTGGPPPLVPAVPLPVPPPTPPRRARVIGGVLGVCLVLGALFALYQYARISQAKEADEAARIQWGTRVQKLEQQWSRVMNMPPPTALPSEGEVRLKARVVRLDRQLSSLLAQRAVIPPPEGLSRDEERQLHAKVEEMERQLFHFLAQHVPLDLYQDEPAGGKPLQLTPSRHLSGRWADTAPLD